MFILIHVFVIHHQWSCSSLFEDSPSQRLLKSVKGFVKKKKGN